MIRKKYSVNAQDHRRSLLRRQRPGDEEAKRKDEDGKCCAPDAGQRHRHEDLPERPRTRRTHAARGHQHPLIQIAHRRSQREDRKGDQEMRHADDHAEFVAHHGQRLGQDAERLEPVVQDAAVGQQHQPAEGPRQDRNPERDQDPKLDHQPLHRPAAHAEQRHHIGGDNRRHGDDQAIRSVRRKTDCTSGSASAARYWPRPGFARVTHHCSTPRNGTI
ncbi:MAG: hypothetical protein WAT25_11400 [Paracoccaceae bacterium]